VSEFFFNLEQAILKKNHFVSAACPTDDISNDDAELGIDNVGGVFLFLVLECLRPLSLLFLNFYGT
jgi:hypothetical protein